MLCPLSAPREVVEGILRDMVRVMHEPDWVELMPTKGGHVFILDGDVSRISCDAWLLPTDRNFWITDSFRKAVGMDRPGVLPGAPPSWGPQGCLLLEHLQRDGDPELWLGDVGRNDEGFDHYASRASEFIEVVSQRLRGLEPPLGRPPLLALNVIGSGEGGKRSERGELLSALLPAIIAAAARHRADVALVTYGPVMYSAAQAVRRRLATSHDLWAELPSDLRTTGLALAEHARNNDLVVFFGAGVSAAAGLPAWRDLLARVGSDLGLDDTALASLGELDPRDQATVIQRRDVERFPAALRSALGRRRPSLLHYLLMSLPVSEFVTTNFDDLFEVAAESANRPLTVLPGARVRSQDRWLLKLHGSLDKDVVLTRDDYLGASRQHVALRGLVQAMLMTRHMLFIGYSLSDEDFHQLVHDVRMARDDRSELLGTALMPVSHPLLRHLWNDVDIVDTATDITESEGTAIAAHRRVALLLDFVGAHTTSDVRFIADDSLGRLRSDDEVRLCELLEQLEDLYRDRIDPDGSRHEWAEVRRFLEFFAAHPD